MRPDSAGTSPSIQYGKVTVGGTTGTVTVELKISLALMVCVALHTTRPDGTTGYLAGDKVAVAMQGSRYFGGTPCVLGLVQ